MSSPSTVLIIGAGFSGLLTALRLLLEPEGPRVVLVEKGPRFGRGAAYSTANPSHLLNVRAANMSALVEQPGHFIEWLAAEGVLPADRQFVTRDRYGQYLQSLLREATVETASGRLVLEHDAVMSLSRDGEGWSARLAMGRTIKADAVVLAVGNLPPHALEETDDALLSSDRYVADPWSWTPPAGGLDGEVLLIGAGLTAVDAALAINDAQPEARMVVLSRHGLTPQPHPETPLATPDLETPYGSPRALFSRLRGDENTDWRALADALRPHVQTIWRSWSHFEREQFLRHLRPWWNVYRHRLAPVVATRLEALKLSGRFNVAAARIHRLTATADGVQAVWTHRGSRQEITRTFAQVVNCTGPRGDLSKSGLPLITGLLAAGLIRPDACRLGVDVDARSRALNAAGEPMETLFAVGPITRGQFYEITSVPDIRLQAADCAGSILNMLALKGRPGVGGRNAASEDRLARDLADFLDQSIAELDVELGSLKFARRVRSAWELRGRRAALGEIALWLDERRSGS